MENLTCTDILYSRIGAGSDEHFVDCKAVQGSTRVKPHILQAPLHRARSTGIAFRECRRIGLHVVHKTHIMF